MLTRKMKPLDHVVTVRQSAPLKAAAELMKRESVGSVVVESDTGEPVGILTDRDIALRAVAWSHGPETPVTEVMSQPLQTMDADSGRSEIISHMSTLGIRRMPLTRDGALVGFASLDDLAFNLSGELQHLTQAIAIKLRRAQRSAQLDEISSDAEEALTELRGRLRYANWITRQRFLDELDEIREQVAKALRGRAI